MTISIDSNIIVALWLKQDSLNRAAARMLLHSKMRGKLCCSAPVYAELLGDPDRTEAELDEFLAEAGITVDWILEEKIWREAGNAFRAYVHRRRSSGGSVPRRILTDFLIGAHAVVRGYSLLTLDQRLYAAAFPRLPIVSG